jgi:hypothetical protein
VNLVAYADESGTHDPTGALLGAEAVAITGLISTKEDWLSFDIKWRGVLIKYDAKYFHFREFHYAWLVATKKREPSSDFNRNPYKNWGENDLNEFIFELAPIAMTRLVIGGWVPTKLYHDDKIAGVPGKDRDPYELCLDHFFDSSITTITKQRAPWKRQPITFLFDHPGDKAWRNAIQDRFHFNQKRHRNFAGVGFGKKEDHTPLQAADMISFRVRHNMGKFSKFDFSKTWPELDDILFKQINDCYEAGGKKRNCEGFKKCFCYQSVKVTCRNEYFVQPVLI